MPVHMDKLKESPEIRDIERWLEDGLMGYLMEERERAFTVEELMSAMARRSAPGNWLSGPAEYLLMDVIVRLVKDGKIKALEYRGNVLITYGK